jgi:hypothetical protein
VTHGLDPIDLVFGVLALLACGDKGGPSDEEGDAATCEDNLHVTGSFQMADSIMTIDEQGGLAGC